MHYRTWIFVLETIIVLPTLVLYIVELRILLTPRGNEYNSSFYKLFIAFAVTDITGLVLSHFFYAVPLAPDIAEAYVSSLPTWSYTIANALLFYLPTVADFLNIAIALNR
ncbi:hypothetical protein PMAYCL1PPCAC_20676, partial [Pristionchus mayeri]